MMKKIELLSPAKDLDCGISAINFGADAVYIGASKFGARASAGNSIQDIEKLISYAHKYYSKVYVVINTVLNDKEIEESVNLIHNVYNIGTDAIIIQDMGLLETDLPPIPLFASTQTHNNTLKKVDFLEKIGFQRVILARELSLNDIKDIKKNTNVELESFIHGALCVSYSGQCYLSHAIGGRSANRGECAQPCRKKYSLKDSSGNFLSKDKYLLSLKDLNLSQYIEQMIDSGITSFKIEGRLKDSNYIKNVVGYYRQKIDSVLEEKSLTKASSGKIIFDFIPNPDKTFNRGYTNYFIDGRKKDLITLNTPKSIGENLGKVKILSKQWFTLDKNIKLANGDGICFFNTKNNLSGTIINKVVENKIFPENISEIKENLLIFRNLNTEFNKQLKNSKTTRKIGINLNIYDKDDYFIIDCEDEDGVKVTYSEKIEQIEAKNKELIINNITKQFSSLGETEFSLNKIQINLQNIYFIPIKTLNNLRRITIEKLQEERINKYKRKTFKIIKNEIPYFENSLDYSNNVINQYAKRFYERHGAKIIESGAETGINMTEKTVMTTKHCLKHHFELCKDKKDLILIDETGKEYKLVFDCKNCNMKILF